MRSSFFIQSMAGGRMIRAEGGNVLGVLPPPATLASWRDHVGDSPSVEECCETYFLGNWIARGLSVLRRPRCSASLCFPTSSLCAGALCVGETVLKYRSHLSFNFCFHVCLSYVLANVLLEGTVLSNNFLWAVSMVFLTQVSLVVIGVAPTSFFLTFLPQSLLLIVSSVLLTTSAHL